MLRTPVPRMRLATPRPTRANDPVDDPADADAALDTDASADPVDDVPDTSDAVSPDPWEVPDWPLPDDPEIRSAHLWSEAAFRAPGSEPFSFVYDGRPSAELLPGWRVDVASTRLDANRVRRTVRYRDPATGLEIDVEITEHRDFAALEWVLRFRNTGGAATPILESIWPLDSSWDGAGDFVVRHAAGSSAAIDDFAFRETALGAGARLDLSPYGGRSSDSTLPFFNIARPGESGVVVGVGWTGQWAAAMSRSGGGPLGVRAGMEQTHLRLLPGEEIRTPAILLLFWNGPDYYRGQVLLRRLLGEHYSPRVRGAPAQLPLAAAPSIAFETVSEANLTSMIANVSARGIGVDTWWQDAGWFESPEGNWVLGVGNFDADPVRFPRGLRPVADAAHAAGLRYLLWLEPERVMPGTWMHRNHPEWLIAPPADLPGTVAYMHRDGFNLLDLGNDAARAWLEERVSAMIREVGVDIYRNDFNLYPLWHWRSMDAPDRQGMTEIRYVTGLYAYYDALRRDHPGLLIDNCASGGRRIDFETLRRSVVLTRSDYLWDPVGQQNHTFGLAKWLPITGIGAASTNPYAARSGYGSHFVLALDYNTAGPIAWERAGNIFSELRTLRDLFAADFTTLSGTSNSESSWVAWQYGPTADGRGVVQAFRRAECPETSVIFPMVGLDPGASYRITDMNTGGFADVGGGDLMSIGLRVDFAGPPDAKILLFEHL